MNLIAKKKLNNYVPICVRSSVNADNLLYNKIVTKPSNLLLSNTYDWKSILKIINSGEAKLSLSNAWYLSKYLRQLTGNLTGFYLEWQFVNIKSFTLGALNYDLWHKIYKRTPLSLVLIRKENFIIFYTRLTILKDPSALIPIIKKQLLNTHLKQHNRIFYSINTFLAKWYLYSNLAKKIKGYSIFFKGKLAKKGSVRKTVFFKKQGAVSYANKSLRVNYRNFFVWTHTGVIGAGFSIYY